MSTINSFRTIWQGLDWSYLTDILMYVIPALICITFHETCHGWVAYRLGDPTAKNMGRLSLNPIRHIDWVGLVMMVVFHFGWAKPVPVDMRNFKNPKRGMAITALAGPVSNLILTALFLVLYGGLYYPLYLMGGAVGHFIMQLILVTAYLSLSLAVFNLIPISPLDGSKVLFAFLSDEAYYKLMRYERYGMILLMALVATGVLGTPLSSLTGFLFDKMFGIAGGVFRLIWG